MENKLTKDNGNNCVRIEKWKWLSNCISWLSLQENQRRELLDQRYLPCLARVFTGYAFPPNVHCFHLSKYLKLRFLDGIHHITFLNFLSNAFRKLLEFHFFSSFTLISLSPLEPHLQQNSTTISLSSCSKPTTPPSFTSPCFHQKLQNYGSS